MKEGHGRAQRLTAGEELVPIKDAGDRTEAELQRGILQNDFVGPGRFGMMFDGLEEFEPSDEALVALGRAMQEMDPANTALNNSDIPAGFTYLGQFIDHDITLDKTVGFPAGGLDPEEIEQARTPSLDLDSLYGLGPKMQPELRDPATQPRNARFAIGRTAAGSSPGGAAPGTPEVPGGQLHDLPRNPTGRAIIADGRNDENLIVAQLHLAFLKFHNKVLDLVADENGDEPEHSDASYTLCEEETRRSRFHRARRRVRWHYQWIVLNDFLPRIVDRAILQDVRTNGRKYFCFEDRDDGNLFMPLEFSVAAYRFGHSMIRESYNYNRVFASRSVEPNALTEATLELLFRFTGLAGGTAPIPGDWVIDWRRFFEVDAPSLLNVTRRIDSQLAPMLHRLPHFENQGPMSLAVRNLKRGATVRLPHGQAVAEAVGATSLTSEQLTSGPEGEVVRQHGFDKTTPLWYYILKEAEVQAGGRHLGEVGSRIVVEVFVGLLEGHRFSFLTKQPDWKPDLPGVGAGNFTMADLLRFVGDTNPLG